MSEAGQLPESNWRPQVVEFYGFAGSGKTSVATALEKILQCGNWSPCTSWTLRIKFPQHVSVSSSVATLRVAALMGFNLLLAPRARRLLRGIYADLTRLHLLSGMGRPSLLDQGPFQKLMSLQSYIDQSKRKESVKVISELYEALNINVCLVILRAPFYIIRTRILERDGLVCERAHFERGSKNTAFLLRQLSELSGSRMSVVEIVVGSDDTPALLASKIATALGFVSDRRSCK